MAGNAALSKAELASVVKQYFVQLTRGCGREACVQPADRCGSVGDAVPPKAAAAQAIKLAVAMGTAGLCDTVNAASTGDAQPKPTPASLNPFDTLPDEMLLKIFGQTEPQTQLVTLGGVCKRWRSVVSELPSFNIKFISNRPDSCSELNIQRAVWKGGITELMLGLLSRFSCLVELDLSDFRALPNETMVEMVKALPHLTHATFAECLQARSSVPEALGESCPQLQSVSFRSNNYVKDDGVLALAKGCKKLRSANFSQGKLKSAAVAALAEHCPQLVDIDFSRTSDITDEALNAIGTHCKNLREANFAFCSKVTDAGVAAFVHCTSITRVSFRKCVRLTDAAVIEIAKLGPSLISVNVSQIETLTNRAVDALATHCPNLRDVDLKELGKLSDTPIVKLAQNCPKLRFLSCESCDDITDAIPTALGEHCPDLEQVCFRWCANITDIGVEELVFGCAKLRRVDFFECRELGDDAVIQLSANCPDLEYACFDYCPDISDDAGKYLLDGCPKIREANPRGLFFKTD